MSATTTYLQIVNNSIQEAGVDLASFSADGSDFLTNTNAMMQRFRVWISRAWKDIQQQCYDWDFMQEQGLCNLTPGIMFYTDGTAISNFSALANTTINIYDQDGTVAIPNVEIGSIVDLTGEATLTLPFGYFNFAGANLATPLNVALKPAAEYFTGPATFTDVQYPRSIGWTFLSSNHYTNLVLNVVLDDTHGYKCTLLLGGVTYDVILMNAVDATSQGLFLYTARTTDVSPIVAALNAGTSMVFKDFKTGAVICSFGAITGPQNAGGFVNSSDVLTLNGGVAYIHSWKSFDFDEETQSGDFQEDIQEIDDTSFRLVDYFAPAPSGEQDLQFIHWEAFRNRFDLSAAYPGLSRLITKDDMGRYRLYPSPYYQISVKFDYARRPQILTAFGDIPRGINDDFVDLIMWKALIYYGKYDEQPSVAARSREEYSNILSRLKQKNVDKVHFKPARLY